MILKDKIELIRKGLIDGVYFVDTTTENYDLVLFPLVSVGIGEHVKSLEKIHTEIVCRVSVPERFRKTFRNEEIDLVWNERRCHLSNLDVRHWLLIHADLDFGRNMSGGEFLRRQVLARKISAVHSEVERLIVLKHKPIFIDHKINNEF